VVTDDEIGVVDQGHRDHGPLAHAAGELVREVVDPGLGLRDADQVEHLHGSCSRGLLGDLVVDAVGLDDLRPDRVERVQGGQCVLEDHRDVVAAQPLHLGLGHADDLSAVELDRS